jgi:hypothetical protein
MRLTGVVYCGRLRWRWRTARLHRALKGEIFYPMPQNNTLITICSCGCRGSCAAKRHLSGPGWRLPVTRSHFRKEADASRPTSMRPDEKRAYRPQPMSAGALKTASSKVRISLWENVVGRFELNRDKW